MFGKYSAGFIDLCLFCWLEIATELGEGGGGYWNRREKLVNMFGMAFKQKLKVPVVNCQIILQGFKYLVMKECAANLSQKGKFNKN